MKADELTEKEAEAVMVTSRIDAGARDKNDNDFRIISSFSRRMIDKIRSVMKNRSGDKNIGAINLFK